MADGPGLQGRYLHLVAKDGILLAQVHPLPVGLQHARPQLLHLPARPSIFSGGELKPTREGGQTGRSRTGHLLTCRVGQLLGRSLPGELILGGRCIREGSLQSVPPACG